MSVRHDGRRLPDAPADTLPTGVIQMPPETFSDDPTSPLPDRPPPPSLPAKPVRAALGEQTRPLRPFVDSRTPPSATKAPPTKPSKPLMILGAAPPPDRATAYAAPPIAEAQRKLGAGKPPRPAGRDAGPALRKDLTLERYADIAAALARAGAGAPRSAVLKANLLTDPGWLMVDQHWKKALAREAEEGGRTLLLAFDEAYLATQARLGKPLGVAEYARILVGLERGQVGRVLGELELELADLMRLQRVWTMRLAASTELTAELAQAVEEARAATG